MYHIQARIEGAYVGYGAYRDGEPGEPRKIGTHSGYTTLHAIMLELQRSGVEYDVVDPIIKEEGALND